MNLLSSRPEKRSSSLGARQKMMERRRKVKVRFTCEPFVSECFNFVRMCDPHAMHPHIYVCEACVQRDH